MEIKKTKYGDPDLQGVDIDSLSEKELNQYLEAFQDEKQPQNASQSTTLPTSLLGQFVSLTAKETAPTPTKPFASIFRQITDASVVAPVEYVFSLGDCGFIEKGRINAVTSIGARNKTGGGKSTLSKILAAAVIGHGVGPIECSLDGPVVYIDCEMGDARTMEYRQQVRNIVNHDGRTYDGDRLITFSFDPDVTATCDDRLMAIVSMMDALKPALLIVDPFAYLLADDSIGDSPIQDRLAWLKQAAARNNTTVIIIAHGTKSDTDANLSGRTGTLLQQDCAFVLGVEHVKNACEDHFKVTPLKSRGVPPKEWHFSFIGEAGSQYPFPYMAMDVSQTMSYQQLSDYMKSAFGDDTELRAGDIDSRLAEIAGKSISWAKDVKRNAKQQDIIAITGSKGKSIFYRLNANRQ